MTKYKKINFLGFKRAKKKDSNNICEFMNYDEFFILQNKWNKVKNAP